MKKVVINCIILFLGIQSAFSLEIKSEWNARLQKEVTLTCSEGDYLCDDFCGKSQCQVAESFCRNCIGNTVFLTHFFDFLGRSYFNSKEEVEFQELFDLLKSGNFASMTSKTIYNHVERFDGDVIRKKFQSLCEGVEYPIVFFKLNPITRRPQKAEYVVCQSKVFKMDDTGDVIVNP